MGVADELERQLPYLRRYARAVTGSSDRGDALVELAMVQIMDGDAGPVSRLDLFRSLDEQVNELSDSPHAGALTITSTDARRALLLTSMEEFSIEEAALIMRTDADMVSGLVAEAEDELKASLATDVFVIEDEPLVAAHISQIATDMGHRVIGQAVTRDQAVEACLSNPPHLLLADVQLADGSSGADAAEAITAVHDIPVIFITAYPQRLLSGEHGEPTYLIPKPFRPDMVKAVISQALIQKSAELQAKK